ncbi:VOC family protein [Cognatishimia sp.]|uniref:VOC family protein n=1 Tax=Cognatishimia sp. TaxID=2211648 RepID=UPI003513BE8F
MAHGEFIWCDLSTFRPEVTKPFYTKLFDWSYDGLTQPDGSAYDVAATSQGTAAAIFQMPQKFVDIGMPSFWMPYIDVDDIDACCETAKSLGGRVEIGPISWGDSGRIALIRDPLGAGFTVMQDGLPDTSAIAAHKGHAMAFALYVSDAKAVQDFYNALFGWTASALDKDTSFKLTSKTGHHVAELHEMPDEERGKEQFWSIQFATPDLIAAKTKVLTEGGEILFEDTATLLARDPDGAAFFLTEAKSSGSQSKPAPKWRTYVGLAAIYLALFTDQNWIWGVLFLLWTIPALRSGETHFVEPISRRETPGLYWFLIATWIGLSGLLVWYGWGV